MTVAKLTLNRQLAELVLAVPAAQRTLDAQWLDELQSYRACSADLPEHARALTRELTPARLMVANAEIEVRMFVSHEAATGFSVRLAGLGLQRRYERTTQAQLAVRCTVAARPRTPFDIQTRSRITDG